MTIWKLHGKNNYVAHPLPHGYVLKHPLCIKLLTEKIARIKQKLLITTDISKDVDIQYS